MACDTCCEAVLLNNNAGFSRTEPGEQLDVAIERYWHQQRVKAGAKLMLRCYMTATLVKAAFRFVAKGSRVL